MGFRSHPLESQSLGAAQAGGERAGVQSCGALASFPCRVAARGCTEAAVPTVTDTRHVWSDAHTSIRSTPGHSGKR